MTGAQTRAARCLQWSRDAEAEGDAEAAGLWRGMAFLAAEADAPCSGCGNSGCETVGGHIVPCWACLLRERRLIDTYGRERWREIGRAWRGMAVAAEKDAKAAPKRHRPCTTWNDSAGNIWCHTVNCDRHLSSNRKVW